MSANVESRQAGQECEISVSGEMTIATASSLKPELLGRLSGCGAASGIALNLSEVSVVDTAGIQLIVLIRREAGARGFRISAASEAVRAAFALYGMDVVAE